MLYLLQKGMLRTLMGENVEDAFSRHFIRNYKKMFTMEEYKYLPPKFSYAVKDLARYFEIYEQGGPLSSMSKNSSEKSFHSAPRVHGSSTQRSTHSLKTIKESMGKKNMIKRPYRYQSSIHRRKARKSSKILPPLRRSLSNNSHSHSRSRSGSKSKSKNKLRNRTNKPPQYRKVRSKVLHAAEKRGLRIQNSTPTSLNQTLTHLKSQHGMHQSNITQPPNILVSDKYESYKNLNTSSQQDNHQLEDYLSKYSIAKSHLQEPASHIYNSGGKYALPSNHLTNPPNPGNPRILRPI